MRRRYRCLALLHYSFSPQWEPLQTLKLGFARFPQNCCSYSAAAFLRHVSEKRLQLALKGYLRRSQSPFLSTKRTDLLEPLIHLLVAVSILASAAEQAVIWLHAAYFFAAF